MKIAINGEILKVSGGGGALPEGTVAIKPLTQAEYDALTDAEKQADVVYAITDDAGSSGSGGSSEEVYSTEETRIGTWIDGKPLYRVALSTKSLPTNAGSVSALHTFSEEVSIVYMLGAIDGVSDATYIVNGATASYTPSQTTSYTLKYVPSSKTILMVGSNGEFANKEIRLIVAYIKTTDTGGAV